ncbi:unnamed protein product [Cyprideis torosa]|uniref:Glucosidase II subunit alpha n=1 Tax=Cyprideis torosa TaxID=163714 RepID=A0A7R8WS91_9CRUS|nr:unnamed protein product [Cyprideis torosa]CAG0904585.1 unnamed protein product [Cyprideis torosa]
MSELVEVERSTQLIRLKNSAGPTMAELHFSPIRLDFMDANKSVLVSLNSRGMLEFEHFRKRKPTEGEQVEEGVPVDEEEEPGMWEESFGTHRDSKPHGPSAISLDASFPGAKEVYGIPEHADTFALKDTSGTDPYRLYNLDVFEYEIGNPMALYGSVPFMIALGNRGTAVGVFWHNPSETWVDISKDSSNVVTQIVSMMAGTEKIPKVETQWISEAGIIDMFVLLGPGPKDVMRQYAALTGPTFLPPLWSLGLHNSRWNYNNEDDVRQVDAGFDAVDFPYDVMWLDIEHTDDKKYFTWDPVKFANPKAMIDNVASKGRKMVTIVDPHIKRDSSYFLHNDATSKGLYVKQSDGVTDYEGWCWPGSSGYLDFLKPETRKYWEERFLLENYQGSTLDLFTWNDMNEPSVFSGPEVTMHKDAIHHGGFEHRELHNANGFYFHWNTYLAHLRRAPNLRPFVLTRSFFSGSQRYAAVWTGDNMADWSHLDYTTAMLLSHSVTGISFIGADIGGFFNSPDAEMLVRWYQAAAFQPFARVHAHIETRRREPWLFDTDSLHRMRQAVRIRYSVLPLWYTLFYEATLSGVPPMRPIWMEFPAEEAAWTEQDSFMLGDVLLVRPVTTQGAKSVNVYFPGKEGTDLWYNFFGFHPVHHLGFQSLAVDMNTIPIYQRSGTILPKRERIRRSASLTLRDPFTLVVAVNATGQAHGSLYMDDGETFDYQKGKYLYLEFTFDQGKLSSKLKSGGDFQTDAWLERVVVLGLEREPSHVQLQEENAVESHELRWSHDPSSGAVVIRKPGVQMGVAWSISIN